jgi:glycosyltransferase involved in cell wall biosynthesis
MSYILSVVIPTKNRYPCLKECLKTLVAIDSDELEIVISDNTADNAEIVNYIQSLNWPHIKYFHHIETLSVVDNSEQVVSHATGEYLCYIGDDDAILHMALNMARYLKKNNIDGCIQNVALYYWPNVEYTWKKRMPLCFKKLSPHITHLNSDKMMNKFLKWGAQDINWLLRVYHAIISKRVMDEIKAHTGSFFPGATPDMTNAISAMLTAKSYAYINIPLILSGTSHNSGAGMGQRDADITAFESLWYISDETREKWDQKIPRIGHGYALWANAATSTLRLLGASNWENRMNYFAFYAKLVLKCPRLYKYIRGNIGGLQGYVRFMWNCFRYALRYGSLEIRSRFRRLFGREFIEKRQVNLAEACDIVNAHNKTLLSKSKILKDLNE